MALGAGGAVEAAGAPPAFLAPALALTLAALALFARRFGVPGLLAAWALGLAAAAAFGAAAVDVRVATLARPQLLASFGPGEVIGRVERIAPSSRGATLVLRVESLSGAAVPPILARIATTEPLSPGRRVRCWAKLDPPRPPTAPGGFDPARRAFFEGVSASGFAFGRCRPLISAEPLPLALQMAAWRRDLSEAIAATAPGAGGALAVAFITGERTFIGPDLNAAFLDSGLTHLLSVSGLHMALVAGFVFALLHGALAVVPRLALVWPIRKIAAAAAIFAAGAYLLLSGASVPAQRAFIMAAVALGAVLVDRPAVSMRGLALAAAIVLAIEPESAIDPGFQMSFMATAALVALYEETWARGERLPSPGPIVSGLRWLRLAIWSSALTSVAAGLATDPIALHTFQRFAVFGLPANMASAPIVSLVVAPAAMAAAALAPFGAAEPALRVMAFGLEQIAAIAAAFADRPEAVVATPSMGQGAFLAALAALSCLCLWCGALRWIAAPIGVLAIGLAITEPQPVALSDAHGRHVLVREEQGAWRWARNDARGAADASRLLTRGGVSPSREADVPAVGGCREGACRWRIGDTDWALAAKDPHACAGAEIVIVPADARAAQNCGPAIRAEPCRGGFAVYQGVSGAVRIRRARPEGFDRPWASRVCPQ